MDNVSFFLSFSLLIVICYLKHVLDAMDRVIHPIFKSLQFYLLVEVPYNGIYCKHLL